MKYMLLIYQGTTPLPGTPEWDALSQEEQGKVYAAYGELNRFAALFTTLTTFGTPRDITLDELAIELFYPADDATEAALRGAGPSSVSSA